MTLWTLGMLVTLALHFAWEMLQAPAFMQFATDFWSGTVRCFVAALGDVVIASGTYAVTALWFRRPAWPVQPGWMVPAATWIVLGVVVTVGFERWALSRGRWAYGSEMPVVFGIGVLPLAQWLVVPAMTLLIVRQVVTWPLLRRGSTR